MQLWCKEKRKRPNPPPPTTTTTVKEDTPPPHHNKIWKQQKTMPKIKYKINDEKGEEKKGT